MRTLAIIPARGGSKGILRKNMAMIGGFPLIHYTIDVAVASALFCGIVVTSDDDEILDYASQCNVYTHKRKAELAGDTSPIIDTIKEVIKFSEDEHGLDFDAVMLLQPTSPLRTVAHLVKAVNMLNENITANSVISVTKMHDIHPARMYHVNNEYLEPLQPELEQKRRQDLPEVYIRNGSIYLARRKSIMQTNDIMVKPSVALIMNNSYHLNIDEPRDLYVAKYMMEENKYLVCA